MSAIVRWTLTAIVVIGLGIDAYTHFDLASQYTGIASSTVSQGTLFRIEAVLAILAGVALIWRANRITSAVAFLVAGGGLAVLLVYRFSDVGTLGPLPNMYEPFWYDEKSLCAWGEAAAAAAALGLLVMVFVGRRTSAHSAQH